jgi:ribosomal protein L3 glutamine methyltransferase
MKLVDCVSEVEQQLQHAKLYFGHGTDNARDEAAWLVMAASGINVGTFDGDWTQELSVQQLAETEKLVLKRIHSGQPLAYILNSAWFAETEFYIDDRAIVPRSHIGEWIPECFEPWLDPTGVQDVLDLCTGGGCIAVALALVLNQARFDAVDISTDALAVAAINARRHAVSDRIRLIQSDLFTALPDHRYDLILCNPPYVADQLMDELPLEYSHEPEIAFSGGSDGLTIIRQVLAESRAHLTQRGLLVVEAGSAALAVESAWPTVPFTWLMSANGESVVFVLSADELDAFGQCFV